MPLWTRPLTGDVVIISPALKDVLEKTLPWISLVAFTFHPFNTGTPFGTFFATTFLFLFLVVVVESVPAFLLLLLLSRTGLLSLLPKKPLNTLLEFDATFVASPFFGIIRGLDCFFGAVEIDLVAALGVP